MQANLDAFVELCRRKLERLSKDVMQAREEVTRLKRRLEDPMFTVFLKETADEAMLTGDDVSHGVLSRLVVDPRFIGRAGHRRLDHPDACKTIRSLTGDQLRFLAIITWAWTGAGAAWVSPSTAFSIGIALWSYQAWAISYQRVI